MFRYILISGGEVTLSRNFADKADRDKEASNRFLALAVRSGLPDDNVILLDNAPPTLVALASEYPTSSEINARK